MSFFLLEGASNGQDKKPLIEVSKNFCWQLYTQMFLYSECLFVCFYGRPPKGRKVGVPIRDSASRPGLALVTPPSRHWTWEQNKHSYLLGQFKSLHHNNSCTLIPLIARNLAGWTFVCLDSNTGIYASHCPVVALIYEKNNTSPIFWYVYRFC